MRIRSPRASASIRPPRSGADRSDPAMMMMMHVAERRGSPQVALLLAILLSVALGAAWSGEKVATAASQDCAPSAHAQAMARSELFFGLARPHGSVSESEFAQFVEHSVTPRFPHGLTLLGGSGQFRGAGGAVVAEGSKLLILLHAAGDADANRKIEQIRDEYRQRFEQQSVLRADSLSCVSF